MTKKVGSKKKSPRLRLKVIILFVVLLSIVIIIYPFVPQLWYLVKFEVFYYDWVVQERITVSSIEDSDVDNGGIEEIDNRLIIPVIGVDVGIVEGSDDSSLNKGAWHRPGTGDPENGGNMVITGHRFQYLPPNNITFYHLDKVVEEDEIIVYWNEIEYDYVVVETFIVEPGDVEIEEDSAYHMLTLYTCTPLWTANKRLIVRAEPVY
jgi:LPXTG-site transpeptidase (sortase) family protein